MDYVELFTSSGCESKLAELGWNKAFVSYQKDQRKSEQTKGLQLMDVVMVGSNLENLSRKAIEQHDLVISYVKDAELARKSSELWTIDAIAGCEQNLKKDKVNHPLSGLDDATCRFMNEKDICYLIDIGELLRTTGYRRSKLIYRIAFNIKLCTKYKVDIALSAFAKGSNDLKTPQDLASIGRMLGLSETQSIRAVSRNPLKLWEKARARADPSQITRGLRVIDWGQQKKKPKQKFGWY